MTEIVFTKSYDFMIRKIVICSTVLCVMIMLSSCASAPSKPALASATPTLSTQTSVPLTTLPLRHNVVHVVGPGETLWRISKMYDVEMQDIVKANNLRSKTKIAMGRRLLIPHAAPLRPIIPLYKTAKWKYIIIHHSATDVGNAYSLYDMHLRRGFWNGLGYHFVIDNGTFGKAIGQIEISPRWIKQQNGAHCKASNMNSRGIGICLVGNYSKDKVPPKMLDSLVYLVRVLQKYYNISTSHILGHGQVTGAATECPGLQFPWRTFWAKLQRKE